MRLTTLCYGVKAGCPSIKNQPDFIDALSKAAGEKLYISKSYKKLLFNGGEEFSVNLKMNFRGKNNLHSLIDFFEDSISNSKLDVVIAKLGIPETGEPNKHALAVALAVQFRAIVDSDNDDGPDVLFTEYLEQRQGIGQGLPTPTAVFYEPLYPGDDIFVDGGKDHVIKSTDVFQHSWHLINEGSQTWTGRKLVYTRNPDVDRPEADPAVIEIPETKPQKAIKITTTFDGRGFDGVFHCKWEMQDKEGRNCFPGRQLLFCVTIDAKFKRP